MHFRPAEIERYPGYFIRRLQQMAVAFFMEETQDWEVTPVQYAALSAVMRHPGIDQRTLARLIRFDTSTIGSVIDRLEARQWLARSNSPTDRRVRLLNLTPEGAHLLEEAEPAVLRAQQRMLEPLPSEQHPQFMQAMAALVHAYDAQTARPPEDEAAPRRRARKAS